MTRLDYIKQDLREGAIGFKIKLAIRLRLLPALKLSIKAYAIIK